MLAQNIAYCLAATPITDEERVVCRHILATVGNFPAGDFISSTVDDKARLPWQLEMSELGRRERNTVFVSGKPELLTDFQFNVWGELHGHQHISVSAPTSAGKSYIVQAFIKETLENSDAVLDIAYVVPSRSLIHEVQGNLSRLLGNLDNAPVVSSVPRTRLELAPHQSRVFVFTQERLRTALDQSELTLDLLIVDEAQQIADGARGMLLQNCLEDVATRMPRSKILFITPGTQSAASIGRLLGIQGMADIGTRLRPVRQNLIYVNFEEAKRDEHMVLTLQRPEGGRLHIGRLLASEANSEIDRFIDAILRLGVDGQSLVYASSKHPAEGIANEIARRNASDDSELRLRELANFIRKHVHPEFTLADCVEQGVGFHFGNMPTNITKAIEEYFSEGLLHTLVCTSTLLQGVNLPARNIFLYKPEKGSHTPMNPDDFWNLAGRAGRLRKDTHGNVFLVSYDSWKNRPAHEPPSTSVTSAFTTALTTEQPSMLTFARNHNHNSGVRRTAFAESVFARLFTDAKTGVLDETIRRVAPTGLHSTAVQLVASVKGHLDRVTLPAEHLKRHAMISPLRQQQMYDVLRDAVVKGNMEVHIPLHPRQKYGEVKERLMFILSLIHSNIEGIPSRAHRYYGWFALSWMRGRSLYDMIDFQLKWTRIQAQKDGYDGLVPAGNTIKRVMKQIEEQLRFKYVKFVACYIDLLKLAAKAESGVELNDVPPIPLFLELGACSGTRIGCMDLGMSRIAAREVTDIWESKDQDRGSVKKQWRPLRSANLRR
ncbi:DEAD/DEAH box helicase [Paraburkholderia sp. Ac-20340]|uniref:DEAD/DEAH box helicase n=1 Tax=Paraburkholderia sp. Ac-20340 TaxID=2703888 RepID=UPI00197D116F|nr:DEAD/DEAH box helicase [Paraburkholderia sp. Ac-20340]MBN3853941.1 DEAD/DEAH box helicase [Paraburkholderia sp. Ac-20340]